MVTIAKKDFPPVIKGFESINRYWDKRHNIIAAKILPGEYYVTKQDEMVCTVLGSCVSACIRDAKVGVGGMNHFMLPLSDDGNWGGADDLVSTATRYGNYAMEHMINDILTHGGTRRNLEVKVFGGGKIMSTMSDIGNKNIQFVQDYLAQEGLKIIGEDLGDIYPRKVLYYPYTGRVLMKKIKDLHNDTIVKREEAYQHDIEKKPVEGDIELF
ncbi:chemoreceptor glutamine deamidase CheD [Pseudomonadota bacterium]